MIRARWFLDLRWFLWNLSCAIWPLNGVTMADLTREYSRHLDDSKTDKSAAFNCKRCDGTGIYTERDPGGRLIERECECATDKPGAAA